jgi:hypothetical protein
VVRELLLITGVRDEIVEMVELVAQKGGAQQLSMNPGGL